MMMTQVKAVTMMTTPTQIPMHLCQLLVAKRAIITAAMVIATFVVIEGIGHLDVLTDTKKFKKRSHFHCQKSVISPNEEKEI